MALRVLRVNALGFGEGALGHFAHLGQVRSQVQLDQVVAHGVATGRVGAFKRGEKGPFNGHIVLGVGEVGFKQSLVWSHAERLETVGVLLFQVLGIKRLGHLGQFLVFAFLGGFVNIESVGHVNVARTGNNGGAFVQPKHRIGLQTQREHVFRVTLQLLSFVI